MILNSKIKSFTIAELMVAVTIFSIVVAISYSVIVFLNNLFKQYEKSIDACYQFAFFNEALTFDLDSCNCIYFNNETIEMINGVDTIKYQLMFKQEGIIRKYNENIDTFKIAFVRFECEVLFDKVVFHLRFYFKNPVIKQLDYYKKYDYKTIVKMKDAIN